MLVLGINETHCATAALVRDGAIIGCASEERFSRLKNDAGWPGLAVAAVLRERGVEAHEIDLVALGGRRAFAHDWMNRLMRDDAYVREYYGVSLEDRKIRLARRARKLSARLGLAPSSAGKRMLTEEERRAPIAAQLGGGADRVLSTVGQDLTYRLDHSLGIRPLGDKAITSCFHRFALGGLHRVSRKRDDRDSGRLVTRLEPLARLPAIQAGHRQVHEDDVRTHSARLADGADSTRGLDDPEAHGFQQKGIRRALIIVVVDDQDQWPVLSHLPAGGLKRREVFPPVSHFTSIPNASETQLD
jgi:hypothetical protein